MSSPKENNINVYFGIGSGLVQVTFSKAKSKEWEQTVLDFSDFRQLYLLDLQITNSSPQAWLCQLGISHKQDLTEAQRKLFTGLYTLLPPCVAKYFPSLANRAFP